MLPQIVLDYRAQTARITALKLRKTLSSSKQLKQLLYLPLKNLKATVIYGLPPSGKYEQMLQNATGANSWAEPAPSNQCIHQYESASSLCC